MSKHRYLSSDESDAVKERLERMLDNGTPLDGVVMEAVAGHLEREHEIGCLSSRWNIELREHHSALINGDIDLEQIRKITGSGSPERG